MSEVDEIRSRMALIRRELHEDVSGVVVSAGKAVNWRSYWRAHPWLMSGIAMAAGYFLVPRRVQARVEVVRAPSSIPSLPSAEFEASSQSFIPQDASWSFVPSPRRILAGALNFAWPLVRSAAQSYMSAWLEKEIGHLQREMNQTDDGRRDRSDRVPFEGRGEPSFPNSRPARG